MILSRTLPRIGKAIRAFARAPGLSLALLLTIALGVGGNAAVYGFLEGLIHPASPLRDSGQIVSLFRQDHFQDAGPLSLDGYQELKKTREVFDWVGAVRIHRVQVLIDGRKETVTVASSTPDVVGLLALRLDKGTVMSRRLFESEFGSAANALGSQVVIEGVASTVSGIAPGQLVGLYSDQSVDLWTAETERDLQADHEETRDLYVLARLHEGVSVRQAQAALPSDSAGLGRIAIVPYTGIAPHMTRGLARAGLFLNFSAAAVFFVACINVASFLLGRALRRSGETSLRVALGATRAELLRDLFAESAVISIAGGAVGVLLGILTAHALPAFLFSEDAERLSFAPRLLPILAASLVCIAVTILCGMLPVLGTISDRPWMVLQRETGSPSRFILRLRSALVVGQIAACCVLVLCTSLLVNGLQSALKTSAGQRLGNPILASVRAPAQPDGPEIDTRYFSEVEKAARSVAGISPLAWTARLPGNQPTWRTFRIQEASQKYHEAVMDVSWITPDILPLLQPVVGRMFGALDQGRRVAVVDERAAAELYGRQTAGVVIRDSEDLPIEIIGVVTRNTADQNQQLRSTIYYGYLDQPDASRLIPNAHFRVPLAPPGAPVELSANVVSANYFAALNMRLLAGTTFREDRSAVQGRVAVINQEAAAIYFKGNSVGSAVIDDRGLRSQIIGVVQSQPFGTFEQHAEPAIYFPMDQDAPPRMTLMLRNSNANRGVVSHLRQRIENVIPRGVGAPAIQTLDTQLARSGLAPLRIATLIGSASAAIALLLSILGLLGAQQDAERQRQRERAVRMALGAQRLHLVLLVLKSAGRLAVAGSAVGTLLSLALLRLLAADFTGVPSLPPQMWLIAPLLPVAAVMLASLLPARRASATSPGLLMRDN